MKLSLQIQWKNYMIIQNTKFPFKKRMFFFLGEKNFWSNFGKASAMIYGFLLTHWLFV